MLAMVIKKFIVPHATWEFVLIGHQNQINDWLQQAYIMYLLFLL